MKLKNISLTLIAIAFLGCNNASTNQPIPVKEKTNREKIIGEWNFKFRLNLKGSKSNFDLLTSNMYLKFYQDGSADIVDLNEKRYNSSDLALEMGYDFKENEHLNYRFYFDGEALDLFSTFNKKDGYWYAIIIY